jgi:hypothetical protein
MLTCGTHNAFPEGGINHGKAYGYGQTDDGQISNEFLLFQNDTLIESIKCVEIKNLYDPSGLFRAGSVIHMLGLTARKYTPKQNNGNAWYCNSDCFSNCCVFTSFLAACSVKAFASDTVIQWQEWRVSQTAAVLTTQPTNDHYHHSGRNLVRMYGGMVYSRRP